MIHKYYEGTPRIINLTAANSPEKTTSGYFPVYQRQQRPGI
jgi:hypothetical protein